MTLEQALRLAMQHQQAGRLTEAEEIYRQIVAAPASHVDAARFLRDDRTSKRGQYDFCNPVARKSRRSRRRRFPRRISVSATRLLMAGRRGPGDRRRLPARRYRFGRNSRQRSMAIHRGGTGQRPDDGDEAIAAEQVRSCG